jgi:hypothetical protein
MFINFGSVQKIVPVSGAIKKARYHRKSGQIIPEYTEASYGESN